MWYNKIREYSEYYEYSNNGGRIMNQKIKDAINDNIVKPLLDERMHNINGEVLKTYYDESNEESDINNFNAADVKILVPSTGFSRTISRVPIMINGTMGGVEGSRIKRGDNVVISFQGGNGNFPRIIGKVYLDPAQRNKELKCDAGNNVSYFWGSSHI